MAEIIMPKMGDAMEEGRIIEWKKKVGDPVAVGDPLFEIETDKSNVEIEAEEAGTLQSIAFEAGQSAPVGVTVAVIGNGAPAAASAAPSAPQPEAQAPAAKSNGSAPAKENVPAAAPPAPLETAAAPSPTLPVATPPQAAPAAAASAPAAPFKPYDSFIGGLPQNLGGSACWLGEPLASGATAATESAGRIKASPVARAMARGNNLDLAAVAGSGANGEITKRDVQAAIAGGGAVASVAAAPAAQSATAAATPKVAEGDEVQPFNAMRRTIAKRLAESKSTIRISTSPRRSMSRRCWRCVSR